MDLPTRKKIPVVLHNQAFHQICGRIERFPRKLGVVCHGCVSHWHGPPPSLLTSILLSKYGAAHPNWFLFNCKLPKLYKFTRFLDLRAFCGFLRAFCRSFWAKICVGARDENGLVCTWDAARMQPVEFDGILKTGSF